METVLAFYGKKTACGILDERETQCLMFVGDVGCLYRKLMLKKLWKWLHSSKRKKHITETITTNVKSSVTTQMPQTDSITQTSIEIHALIEFIDAYEKDNAERLKKEKEIEERFWHRDKNI